MAQKKVNPFLTIGRQAAAEEEAQATGTVAEVERPVEIASAPTQPVVAVEPPESHDNTDDRPAPTEEEGGSEQVVPQRSTQRDGAEARDGQLPAKRTRRPRKEAVPEPEQDPEYDPNETVKISVGMTRAQADYIKNTSVGSGVSLTDIGLAGMLWRCKQIEKEFNDGQPFPPRRREPKKGRPIQ